MSDKNKPQYERLPLKDDFERRHIDPANRGEKYRDSVKPVQNPDTTAKRPKE